MKPRLALTPGCGVCYQRMLVPQRRLGCAPTLPGRHPSKAGWRQKIPESAKGKRKVARVMREFDRGTLRSGSKRGPKVSEPAQAKAIAMSEGRRVSREARR